MSDLTIAKQTFSDPRWNGQTGICQLDDAIICWDTNGQIKYFENPQSLKGVVQTTGQPVLILTATAKWDQIEHIDPELFASGVIKAKWNQYPGAP